MSGQFLAFWRSPLANEDACVAVVPATFRLKHHWSLEHNYWSCFLLSFNTPSLRFQICVWIKPVPKETPQGATRRVDGATWGSCQPVCYRYAIVCTTNKPSGWDCQDQNLCFLFESIGESQNCSGSAYHLSHSHRKVLRRCGQVSNAGGLEDWKKLRSETGSQVMDVDWHGWCLPEHSTPELLQKN